MFSKKQEENLKEIMEILMGYKGSFLVYPIKKSA